MASSIVFLTSAEAEQAFYSAFEKADIETMMAVWEKSTDVVCIHPGGPRLQGIEAIMASWKQIFSAQAHLRFTLTNQQVTQDNHLAVHLLKERIEVDDVMQGVMLTTNIYRFIGEGWKLTLHHASPDPQFKEKVRRKTPTLH
jgi:ketosteroid isomerase-like protein